MVGYRIIKSGVSHLRFLFHNGILWILAWCIAFTLTMVFSKTLRGDLPVSVVIWIRLIIGLAIIAPWYFSQERDTKSFINCKADYGVRIISVCLSLICTYFAYSNLPIGLATAIGFTGPLMVALLSPFMVGDKLTTKQFCTLIIGYFGVWIILLPDTGAELIHIIIALGANFFAAIALLSVKRLSNKKQSSINILFYSNIGALVLLTWRALSQWINPTMQQWVILFLIGLLASLCQWFYVEALKRGRPAILASLEYSRLFIAIPMGILWFQEPWIWSLPIGGAIILLSNVYVTKTSLKAP